MITVEKVRKLLEVRRLANEQAWDDLDLQNEESPPDPFDGEITETREYIESVLCTLEVREEYIVRVVHGLGEVEMSFVDIAKQLSRVERSRKGERKLTGNAVQEIYEGALEKISLLLPE